jgi:hypothetical protein
MSATAPPTPIASAEITTPEGGYIPLLFRVDEDDARAMARFLADGSSLTVTPPTDTMNQRIRRAAGRKG